MKQTAMFSLVIVLTLGASATFAGEKMDDMNMAAPPGKQQDAGHQAVQGKGVVKAVDPGKGTITIAHEAIPTLKWPAMTMSFKIDKQLASTVKPGEHVTFELVANGMGGAITKVTALK